MQIRTASTPYRPVALAVGFALFIAFVIAVMTADARHESKDRKAFTKARAEAARRVEAKKVAKEATERAIVVLPLAVATIEVKPAPKPSKLASMKAKITRR